MFVNLTLLVKCDTPPVLRYTPDGKPVVSFWASSLTGEDEKYRELARYYISLYGPKAEKLNDLSVENNHLVLIRGSLIGNDAGAPRVHTRQDQTVFTAWEVQAQDVIPTGGQVADDHRLYGYQAVDLVGNLGQDPKTNQTQAGKTVTNLSIACNVYDATKATPPTVWVRAAFWGNSYTKIVSTLSKGRKVFVSGVLKSDETGGPRMWQDQSGQIRASFEMTGFRLQYADPKPGNGAAPAGPVDLIDPLEAPF